MDRKKAMSEEMIKKIDTILERVKDPESDLPVSRLGVIERVRYSEQKKQLHILTNFIRHRPSCLACAGIATLIESSIMTQLEKEFQRVFPDLSITFS